MPFTEHFKLTDSVTMGLSDSPEEQPFLPPMMYCPQGHEAYRHFHYSAEGHPAIPFYACYDCTIVFRFQELRLLKKNL